MGKDVPFHFIVEVPTKLEPLTVSIVFPAPAWIAVGAIDVMAETGLLTVKVIELDDPPPGAGFATVIVNDPAETSELDGIVADS